MSFWNFIGEIFLFKALFGKNRHCSQDMNAYHQNYNSRRDPYSVRSDYIDEPESRLDDLDDMDDPDYSYDCYDEYDSFDDFNDFDDHDDW